MNWKGFLQATAWQFKQPSTCAFNHDLFNNHATSVDDLLCHGIKMDKGWSSE